MELKKPLYITKKSLMPVSLLNLNDVNANFINCIQVPSLRKPEILNYYFLNVNNFSNEELY